MQKSYYSSPEICLINNPSHAGIRSVGLGYRRAFESLGIAFDYIEFRDRPVTSVDEVNMILYERLIENNYKYVYMIQPTYMMANLYIKLKTLQSNGTKFIAINTEDPYSTDAMMPIADLFHIIFTNESEIERLYKKYANFKYMPVAFDSLQPFKSCIVKQFDVAFLLTIYEDRMQYLKALENTDINLYFGGSIGPLFNSNQINEMKFIGGFPSFVPRHIEYAVYDSSYIVLNPHRKETATGSSYFNLGEGVKCRPMIKRAVSPNPRFFDAVALGAVCLTDRDECFNMLIKYGFSKTDLFNGNIDIKEYPNLIKRILDILKNNMDMKLELSKVSKMFKEKENYIERTKSIFREINGKE